MSCFCLRFLVIEVLLVASCSVLAFQLRAARVPADVGMGLPGISPPPGLDPRGVDKVVRPMPEQGFNEFGGENWVQHTDHGSVLGDWRRERPRQKGELSNGDSKTRACAEHPEYYLWCDLWLKDQAKKAMGPSIVHRANGARSKSISEEEHVSDRIEYSRRQKVEKAKSKRLRVARQNRRKAEAETLSGWERGLHKTREQAGDVTDELTAVFPTGKWSSQGRAAKKKKDADQTSKNMDPSFPPGMVSKSGGPSPYEPAASGASFIPTIINSVSNLW